jgi:uroporphyrinogen-III synthase
LRLLITRAAEDAARTAERLKALGHEAVVAPVIAVVPTGAPPPAGPFDALLLTSAHAAPALVGRDWGTRPVFAVGPRSAAAAREAGFLDVREASGDAAALAALVRQALPPPARLLHAAGRDRKPEASLARAGYAVTAWEVYAAEALPALPPMLRDALQSGGLDGALHYSRRSAEILLTLADGAGMLDALLSLTHLCLSEDVAAPLRAASAARVRVAERPEERILLAAIDPVRGGSPDPASLL